MKHLFLLRRYIILVVLSLLIQQIQAQEQLNSKEEPFHFSVSYNSDLAGNFFGGLNRFRSYYGNVHLSVAFSTEKAGLWKGGQLLVHGLNVHGDNPSATSVGDFQPISRIEASERTILYQCWYGQQVGQFFVLIGRHDMNAAFAVNPYSGNLINTSFGIFPSKALNQQLSIYPACLPGAMIKWEPSPAWKVQLALYDSAPPSFTDNEHNIKWGLRWGKPVFWIAEVQRFTSHNSLESGAIKVGLHYNTARFADPADSSRLHTGSWGVYTTLYQVLTRKQGTNAPGLGGFTQLGVGPGRENYVSVYGSFGFTYAGLLPARPQDEVTIGFGYSRIQQALYRNHTDQLMPYRGIIQMNYKARLGKHFVVQPDLQYILNPGASRKIRNPLIGIVRLAITY